MHELRAPHQHSKSSSISTTMRHIKIKTVNRIPKFSISILAMNGLDMTRKCVECVMASTESWELLLTDNASADGTAAYFDELAAKDIRISVVHNAENKGFVDPNNAALTRARGDYFICLNNDVEVPEGWLTALEKPFLDCPTAAISGPTGSCCSLQAKYPSFHGSVGKNFEYVEGSCLCIPTELARKHTLFAWYLPFAYSEDVDLSLRMRCRGVTSKHVPGIHEIQVHNGKMLLERWGNYHQFRRFDLPILIRRKEALGDILLTTPLIRALRDQCPRSEIYFETRLPHVLKGNPHVKLSEPFGSFWHIMKWARVIELDDSYENMLETHIVDGYFKKALIVPSEPLDRHLDNYITAEDEAFAATLEGDRWVAVHVGPSTWPGKEWPAERFQKLCQWLMDNQWKVVLVGAAGPSYPNYLDLRRSTTLQQLAAI